MRRKSIKDTIISVILLCLFFGASLHFISKSIKEAIDEKQLNKILQIPKVKNALKNVAINAQKMLKSIKHSVYLEFSSLNDKDFRIYKYDNTYKFEVYITLANIISKDSEYSDEIESSIIKEIKEIDNQINSFNNKELIELIIQDSQIILRVLIKDIDSIKDSDEKQEVIKKIHESYSFDINDYESIYEFCNIQSSAIFNKSYLIESGFIK